jgi:hypothetical protein
MERPRILFLLVYSLIAQVFIEIHWHGGWPRPASAGEVHVNLLGQPCLLSGPFETPVLNLIHSLGPAQIYPNLTRLDQATTKDQITRVISKIQNAKILPPLLDRYRERLARRLQNQLKFILALQSKSPSDALLKLGREIIREPLLKKYENLLRRKPNLEILSDSTLTEQLFEVFNEAIEPDPEAEFHRATKNLHIQYNCSFEENDPASETTPRQNN